MKEERLIKRKKRKIKFWTKFIVLILLCLAAVFLLKAPLFQVNKYVIDGNRYYTDDEIKVMGNCKTGGNIFIGTSCKDIKKRLSRDAYMEEVKVKRILPDTIKIELNERVQAAAVVYGSKFVIIDQDGTVLRKTGVEPELTVIKGLTISKLSVGEKLETEEKVLLRQALELIDVMTQNKMYFKAIALSEGEIEAFVLDNLICKGTPGNIIKAMQSNNLQLVVEELFSQKIERGTIKISGDKYISFSPKVS